MTSNGLQKRAYSIARRDRCGAQISEELIVYGYCMRHGLEYVGAVGDAHFDEHHRLCKLLNLPLPVATLPAEYRDYLLIEPEDYSEDNYPDENVLMDGRFRQHVRDLAAHLWIAPSSGPLEVALHLRRGDVRPTGKWAGRYLPNAYFLGILHKLRDRAGTLRATVYSQSNSAESFDEFRALGCEVRLDTDTGQAWVDMMRADVLVMSQSAFSWIPALYNENFVVYAPSWYCRLDPWVDSTDPDFERHVDRFVTWRNAGRPSGGWGRDAPGAAPAARVG